MCVGTFYLCQLPVIICVYLWGVNKERVSCQHEEKSSPFSIWVDKWEGNFQNEKGRWGGATYVCLWLCGGLFNFRSIWYPPSHHLSYVTAITTLHLHPSAVSYCNFCASALQKPMVKMASSARICAWVLRGIYRLSMLRNLLKISIVLRITNLSSISLHDYLCITETRYPDSWNLNLGSNLC